MRTATLIAAASLTLFATVAASAGRPVSISDDLVAGRQAGMRMSGALMMSMKGVVDRGEDVKGQAFAARSLLGWARAVPGLFPLGSEGRPGGALPAVWGDRAGFEAKSALYAAAAEKLANAAQAGDKAGFAAALGEVRGTCGGCHDGYKKP